MPIIDVGNTTSYSIGSVWDVDGTTGRELNYVYDVGATTSHLVYEREKVFYITGSAANTIYEASTVFNPSGFGAEAPYNTTGGNVYSYTNYTLRFNTGIYNRGSALIGITAPAFVLDSFSTFYVQLHNVSPTNWAPNMRFIAGITNQEGTVLLSYARHFGIEGESYFEMKVPIQNLVGYGRPYIGMSYAEYSQYTYANVELRICKCI